MSVDLCHILYLGGDLMLVCACAFFLLAFALFYICFCSRMNALDDAKRLLPTLQQVPPPMLVRTESEGAVARSFIWRSCCVEMDSRALLFFSQLVISLLVLIFFIYEIAVLDDAQWAKMTGTFIIGVWLPAPRVSK